MKAQLYGGKKYTPPLPGQRLLLIGDPASAPAIGDALDRDVPGGHLAEEAVGWHGEIVDCRLPIVERGNRRFTIHAGAVQLGPNRKS